MKKIILLLTCLTALSTFANQCPELDGRYDRCYSEIKKMRGEYIIDQVDQNGVAVFNVQFIDDETDESRVDKITANGKTEYRKERVPVIGIKVDVASRSFCQGNQVVTEAVARGIFNKKLGEFTTTLSRNKDQLTMLIKGSYIGRSINKVIKCQLVN